MPTWAWILIAIGAAIVIGAIAWSTYRKRRSLQLQDTFGAEYDRTVADAPTRREAEADLAEREKRHQEFELKPLDPQARERYVERWRQTQEQFVDDPEGAVGQADGLIQEVMRERGYPVENFEQRSADISVDHPRVVENYREGHRLAGKSEGNGASTEDLRHAMRHYRALFEELVERPAEQSAA